MSLLQAEPALDDPPPSGPRPPRRRLRRALIGFNIFLVICIAVVGGAYAFTTSKLSKIRKIEFDGAGSDGEKALREPGKGVPFNILVVGSDSRAGFSRSDAKQFGTEAKVGGQRSDVMMVVRLDPKTKRANVLSIPRDLWVDLEGGGKGRLNEAFASRSDQKKADPERLVRTIKANLGITVNHYIEVNFSAFRQVVDAVGGVDVYFPFPARDDLTDLIINETGCVHLDGPAALAYVRSRHYEFRKDGRWQVDPTGDLGRIERQQQFLRTLVSQIKGSGLTDVRELNRVIDGVAGNLTTDAGFEGELLSIARQYRDLDPGAVTYLSLPTVPITVGGAQVLRLDQPATDQVLVAFGSQALTTTTTARPSGPLPVRVQNGTTTPNLAANVASGLTAVGMVGTAGGNAAAITPRTTVRYPRGALADAKALSGILVSPAVLREDPTLARGGVLLVVGNDWKGISPKATTTTTAAPTTTTTAAPATTTTAPPAAPKGSDFSKTC